MSTETVIESVLIIICGYLLGSVSATYLVGQWLGGKDLRQFGSGSLGGSMVYEHVGRWAVVPVILWDVGKAAVPTWLALYLGLSMGVAAAAGMAAAVGHNWSIFLRFYGGGAMGTFAGVLLVIFPWGLLWLGGLVAIGWRLGDSAPWLLVSLITMPLLAYLAGGPDVVLPLAGAMLLVTLLKRLEANRRPLPPPGPEAYSSTATSPIIKSGSTNSQMGRDSKPARLPIPSALVPCLQKSPGAWLPRGSSVQDR